ncbi:HK97 family phage prohead protease [Gimibacter soli]|uniref:HK97 family phage prohead protease n=1 Tax=Gimibacter soli TaxID=3024400 RepID=A0AAE9XS19_9PROT|nr:HK97 family phage prohead protease [Gimibacter soli]WCL55084.1 HK97 family phage prohead protease [Gimibacter soli]
MHDVIDLKLEAKAAGPAGTFEGYGAVFGNVDRDGDRLAKGAFAESLKVRMPALLWQHNAKEPIGCFDHVAEDARGLHVKGRLSMEGRGKEAYDLLKMGALDGLSIGFVTREASRDVAAGVRTILKADLMEISLVTFPANELARVAAVKSAPEISSPRGLEHFLREAGLTRMQAKAVTAKGYKGLARSSDDQSAMIATMMARLARKDAGVVSVEAPPGQFGAWVRLPATGFGREDFDYLVNFSGAGELVGAIELEVAYQGLHGPATARTIAGGLSAPSGSLTLRLPGGSWQEPQVRARSLAPFGQNIRVTYSG